MNSNIVLNVSDFLSNQDVATKNYVDTNSFTTAGGVVSCDIKLNIGSDLIRSLGCNYVTTDKKFTLLLRTEVNMLSYSFPYSGLSVPLKIKTVGDFSILINQLPICDFSEDVKNAVNPSI